MGDGNQGHKSGRRQTRFRSPSIGPISTKPLDWVAIEDACGLSFSAKARGSIQWAADNYRMMNSWPTMTRSEFLDAAKRMEGVIRNLRLLFNDSDKAFETAMRSALMHSGRWEAGEAGIEWSEASQALIRELGREPLNRALDRVGDLLSYAPKAAKHPERWPQAVVWERYVAVIVEAFVHDGHSIAANVSSKGDTPLIAFLREVDLKGKGTDQSFIRHVQKVAQPLWRRLAKESSKEI